MKRKPSASRVVLGHNIMGPRARDCRRGQKALPMLSEWLRLLAEPNRLKIICCLGREERCVCEIMSALRLPANLISHHLKKLKKADLLKCRRQGKFQFYRLNRRVLNSFIKNLIKKVGG